MSNNIEFERGRYGLKATIRGVWKSGYLEFLLDRNIKELELNDGKGWAGNNIDFLKYMPTLSALTVIDFKIKIYRCYSLIQGLKCLQISTLSNDAVDFNSFPSLVDCSFDWIKGSESLFDVVTLEKLYLNKFDGKNSASFSKLYNLNELSILNSNITNLFGLINLNKLESLRLANLRKITSLEGIQNLKNLRHLEIHRCRSISTIDEIFELYNLIDLLLIDLGDIETIAGIENLQDLNMFMFYESTNIKDGNLVPLTKLRNLKKISFQNRRHYTHKREDFEVLNN